MSDQDRFHAEVTSEQEWRESLEDKHPSLRAWPGKKQTMSVFTKLNQAREKFHSLSLKKTGHNKFAGYYYFELGDFLIPALQVFRDVGLCAYVSFDKDKATMTIVDLESAERMEITSPMGSAALKGCHEVQNIGAVETYQRRYLWVAALEIVEHDALDATTGKDAPAKSYRSSPTQGAMEDVQDEERRLYLQTLGSVLDNLVTKGDTDTAYKRLVREKLDDTEYTALWECLKARPGVRAALKKHADTIKAAKKEEAAA